jgi:hypothetical protein
MQKMLSNYSENLILKEKKFTDKFIKELSVNFPEKVVALMGMEFSDAALENYVVENKSKPESFIPTKFKKFISTIPILNNTIQATSVPPTNAIVGQIYFDTAHSALKLFDGLQWTTIKPSTV